MKDRNKIIFAIILLVTVFTWEKACYYVGEYRKVYTLKNSRSEIISARVENISQIHKTKRQVIKYSYEYDHQHFEDEKVLDQGVQEEIAFKTLYPVLISAKNPQISFLLFYPDDFKKFGFNVPASLR